MEDDYAKAYKEVVEILKYVPEESVNKIPTELLETFRENMDKDYRFIVDVEKSFEEQNILDETKAILANIFRDYWATEQQRERIIEKENKDREIDEARKREKYNPNDLFKNRPGIHTEPTPEETTNEVTNGEEEDNLPVEVKKEKFFEKIIGFFKKVFHIN